MDKRRNRNGITLIALVITIIVLLVLAGIAISMVSGNNGILNRTVDAKTKNSEAKAEEQRRLAIMEAATNFDGTTYTETVKEGEDLITKTAKILPGLALTGIDGQNTIDEGLVAVDSNGNEYVWIEVPKTENIYGQGNLNLDTSKQTNLTTIETKLRAYSNDYKERVNDKDDWYAWVDSNGNEKCDYNEIVGGANSSLDIKELNNGCGLSYNEYYKLKNKMLKSIYENSGFWIGMYEAGYEANKTEEVRTASNKSTLGFSSVKSQRNLYAYNHVTCSEAQDLASKVFSNSETTSSLMFGVQWSLVLKFIANNIGERLTNNEGKNILKQDSSEWGNYRIGSNSKILKTGEKSRNSILNIYDLAGNLAEYTLERTWASAVPTAGMGGNYDWVGSQTPAYKVWGTLPDSSSAGWGFRVALY